MQDDSERSDDGFKYTEGRQAAGSLMGHGENTDTHPCISVFVGIFKDMMHYPSPHLYPNHPKQPP